ncbi:hypothetical protein Y032_0005g2623 [Ancylostoma ceylanicum]|uniref:Uncharacterized protein n=1 Tax=Ancylostoma ceylanicum TaxID=53326 RepID=A0A016VUE4_9BILA|nr:hypothetical protein Y032_0005g2623 [Ancylostoma ceylanicum]
MFTGVFQYAEHECDNHFVPSIDLSTLLIFRNFCPRVGEDVSTGVIQYAEREHNNSFARSIDLLILLIFAIFAHGSVRMCLLGLSNKLNANIARISEEFTNKITFPTF